MPRAFLIKKHSPVKESDMRFQPSEGEGSFAQPGESPLSDTKGPFDLRIKSRKNGPSDQGDTPLMQLSPPAVAKAFSPIIVSSSPKPERPPDAGFRGRTSPPPRHLFKPVALLDTWQRPLWPPPMNFSFYLFPTPSSETLMPQGQFTPLLHPPPPGFPVAGFPRPHPLPGPWSGREGPASPDSSDQGTDQAPAERGREQVLQAARYQCLDCTKTYATYSGLSKHRQFHCAVQPKKTFTCKHCTKAYLSLGALKMHIRTHTLPCKCGVCGKAFSRPWLLQGHIRTHTGEKPFACAHCNRAFADRSNLRAHLQTHSDVKKYCCSACSKSFSRMSLLAKHNDSGCSASVIKVSFAPNDFASSAS